MSHADDWVEIAQLRAAYSHHYDAPDLDALVDLYTDDAICRFGAYGTATGKDEIRAVFAENMSSPDNNYPSLHATTNPMIEIDGDEAHGKFFLLDCVLTGGPDEPVIRVAGVYNEHYRREHGQWQITETDLRFLWNSDVGRIRPGAERKLEWHPDAAVS